ncbi:MAG: ATP-binding protein [Gemmatimonadota bacterium]
MVTSGIVTHPADTPHLPPSGMNALAREWGRLTTGAATLHEALQRELDAAWDDAVTVLTAQAESIAALADSLGTITPSDYPDIRNNASQVILRDVLDRWDRRRPLERAQLACEAYHRDSAELVRRLAGSIEASGSDVLAVLDSPAGSGPARWLLRRRTTPQAIPIAAVATAAFVAVEAEQLDIQSRYLVLLAEAGLVLRNQWDATRTNLDAAVGRAGIAPSVGNPDLTELMAPLEAEVRVLRTELSASFELLLLHAADRLVATAAWHSVPRPRTSDRQRLRRVEHWGAQLGALDHEFRFERRQDDFERQLLGIGTEVMTSLESERAGLLTEMDDLIRGLEGRLAGSRQELPDGAPIVVPRASRSAELMGRVTAAVEGLPAEVGLIRRLKATPVHGAQLRRIEPARMAGTAFSRVAQPAFDALFARVQASHLRLLQVIDRAHQVVEFAAVGEGTSDDASVNREALGNARALLVTDREATEAALPMERDEVGTTLATTFGENRLLLSRGRLGALAHLGRLGIRHGSARALAAALPTLRDGGRRTGRAAGSLWHRLLVAIQWVPASHGNRLDVVRRPSLPQEFILDPREKPLPAIYRRLFRVEAVSDPRFLVGREREMRALAEARAFWEAGRPVATLIIGERGSGKTSLINCALAGPLAGLPLVRGEFNRRIATASGVRSFLAELVGGSAEDLEATLRADRRVIVLEETERIFLREMGGFDGVGELQRLIAATSATTLWMVVANKAAFRFLDAAVNFGASFSHRIDAASASPEAIRDAILVRHHLSGLRLRFTPPPADRGLLGRLRRRVRGQGDPEQLFFAGLARESAGVFRTAFELWLGQIASVEGSALVLKPMTSPDIDAVIEQLDADDLFTFVAIKQHGSLTPEEHAAVFRRTPTASRAELDDLLVREIIESEPGRPGFRIRPGALRVVREALHRRNLG